MRKIFRQVALAAVLVLFIWSLVIGFESVRAQQFPDWKVSGNTASFEQAQGKTFTGVGNNTPKLRCSITASGDSLKVVYNRDNAAPGLLSASVPNIHAEITYTVFSRPVMVETQGLFETGPSAKPKIASASGFGTETKGQFDKDGKVVYTKMRYDAPISYLAGGFSRGWFAPVIAQGQERTGMNRLELELSPCIKNAHTIPLVNPAMKRIVTVAGILGWKTK